MDKRTTVATPRNAHNALKRAYGGDNTGTYIIWHRHIVLFASLTLTKLQYKINHYSLFLQGKRKGEGCEAQQSQEQQLD